MQTGCTNDAYTAQFVYINDGNGNQRGSVQLRFSPSCGTNWTTVTSYIGSTYIDANVYRIYDGLIEYGSGWNAVVWSNMVYAPDANSAWGSGCVWTPDGASNYCAQTPNG